MIARSLILALALGLAACSSGGGSAFEKLGPLIKEGVLGGEEAPPPRPEPTRAELNAIPFATIALSSDKTPARAFVIPVADNGGYLVYMDQLRRSVVLRGGLLTATHGLGYNLSAIKHQADDPIAYRTPMANWPGTVVRNYQFHLSGREDYEITLTCTLQPVARETVTIVELTFSLMRVEERCVNSARVVENTYWAEPDSGFIWKSRQWVGPRQDPLIVEIIRPYKGARG